MQLLEIINEKQKKKEFWKSDFHLKELKWFY